MEHEHKVERFYSTGKKIRTGSYDDIRHRTWEFLSFGYWEKGTKSYLKAANRLLDFVIGKSGISDPGVILNVACGYGTESFRLYKRFHPKKIIGIDITKKHVDYSNEKAHAMNLGGRIEFLHGNACNLDFPDGSFSHIIGIEGPAHFNTRCRFFREAKRVLKRNGKLVLTDIVMGKRISEMKKIQKRIMRYLAKRWIIPDCNWVDTKSYFRQLARAGFKEIRIEKIGNMVFPGYARNSLTLSTFRNRLRQRGVTATLGLTVISYMLGYLYRKKMIDYIFVSARA